METFAALVNRKILLPSQKTSYIAVEMNFLSTILAVRISQIRVDELFYNDRYPDVVVAIANGTCASATDHYVHHGFYEHRMPRAIAVDEDWYLRENPDVARAVSVQEFSNGQSHFDELGFQEGRLPFPSFTLAEPQA